MRQIPEADLLRTLLAYDPNTGALVWRPRKREMFQSERTFKSWNTKSSGKAAGGKVDQDGYLRIGLLGKDYLAHRIVWKIHYGSDPADQIDHIDGDRSNNRICNLRVVTNSENQRNAKRPANNTSGVTGVLWHRQRQKWCARIRIDGVDMSLGLFKDQSDAILARKKAERLFGFHPNHGRAA